MSSPLGYRFSSSRTADRLVAGVPAAARLAKVHVAALPGTPLLLVLGDSDTLAPLTRAEIMRLAPGLVVELPAPANVTLLPGEYIVRGHVLDPEAIRLTDTVEKTISVRGNQRYLGLVKVPYAWE